MTDGLTKEGLEAFMKRQGFKTKLDFSKALGLHPLTMSRLLDGRSGINLRISLALAALAYSKAAYEGEIAAFIADHGYKSASGLARALKTDRETVKRWEIGTTKPSLSDRLAMAALAANLPPMV